MKLEIKILVAILSILILINLINQNQTSNTVLIINNTTTSNNSIEDASFIVNQMTKNNSKQEITNLSNKDTLVIEDELKKKNKVFIELTNISNISQ